MAETSVLSALDLLASPLMQDLRRAAAKFLLAQASGIDGVPARVSTIQDALRLVVPLLGYADRWEHDASVGDWVAKVRSVAQDVEDILEDHACDTFAGAGGGVVRVVHGIGHAGDMWRTYCRTAHLLEQLMTAVAAIRNNASVVRKLAGLRVASVPESPHRQTQTSFGHDTIREDFSVSFRKRRGEEWKKMKRWIMEESAENIAMLVHGVGGVGKTTLADEIYRDPQVVRRFECQAWVTAARSDNRHTVLKRLAAQFVDDAANSFSGSVDGNSDEEEDKDASVARWIGRIRGILEDRRCLIVFDNVVGETVWDAIGDLLEVDSDAESRILITSREKDALARVAGEGRVLVLETLSNDQSWSLFCESAFRLDPDPECPRELEPPGRRIVAGCEGVPLAILAAASAMSGKERDGATWERACGTLQLQLKLHECPSRNILTHAYYELPSRLKRCLLYCALFPADRPIGRKQLVRLCVAEGFAVERNGRTLEEAAEGYLRELTNRGMLQVARRSASGRAKAYALHEILGAIALDVSRKQKFGTRDLRCDCRRLALANRDHEVSAWLRSLLVFAGDARVVDRRLELPFVGRLKLLRVLELRGASITEVPEWVFALHNLRYLGLRETKVRAEVFPKEVEQLQQLQTLDLWRTEVQQLPRNIVKLRSLRHLIYCGANAADMRYRNPLRFRGREAPRGIWDMVGLRTLKTVEATDELVRKLGELTQLRTLSITKVEHRHYLPLLDSVSRMRHLSSLTVKTATGRVIPLEALRAAPLRLGKLMLKGSFPCAPAWFAELESLAEVYLSGSGTCESPLEALGLLPRLAVLVMEGAYTGERLVFGPRWFPRLRRLCLEEMGVRSIVVGKGALPALEQMAVGGCGALGRDWQGVENLTALVELRLREPAGELLDFLAPLCREMKIRIRVMGR